MIALIGVGQSECQSGFVHQFLEELAIRDASVETKRFSV
jgi:hypothetical protein